MTKITISATAMACAMILYRIILLDFSPLSLPPLREVAEAERKDHHDGEADE